MSLLSFACVEQIILKRVYTADIWKRHTLSEFLKYAKAIDAGTVEAPESWREQYYVSACYHLYWVSILQMRTINSKMWQSGKNSWRLLARAPSFAMPI